jgi:predicted RNA-binding Zn-ribbon protein involved in translation (DUF1610 family)
MKKHTVVCSLCNKESSMSYNGEHFLCPEGWYELYDDHKSIMSDIHICDKCFVSLKTQPKEE